MHHTQDLYISADNAVHDDVVANWKTSPASSEVVITRPSQPRMIGE